MLEQAAALAAAAGDVMWQCDSLGRLAERRSTRGRVEGADEAAREALRLARDMNDRQGTIWGLALLARHATDTGRRRRAGRIWGGLEAEVQRGGPVGQWELRGGTRFESRWRCTPARSSTMASGGQVVWPSTR